MEENRSSTWDEWMMPIHAGTGRNTNVTMSNETLSRDQVFNRQSYIYACAGFGCRDSEAGGGFHACVYRKVWEERPEETS